MTDEQSARLRELGDRLETAIAAAIECDEVAAKRNESGSTRQEPAIQPQVLAQSAGAVSPNEVTDMITKRSHRRLLVAGVIGGAVVASVGTAAAITALDEDEVADGMPAGAVVFADSDPTCTALDADVFWCTLDTPLPQEEVEIPYVTEPSNVSPDEEAELIATGSIPEDWDEQPPTMLYSYRGNNQTFLDAEGRIAGGCIGLDEAGQTWLCVAGQRAVDLELLNADLLGEPSGPAVG